MLQLHPDKLSPDLDPSAIASVTEKFHNVKDAYEFLVSPQYLTARRLYQAKMASRRAEYERREAFLRRANCAQSGVYTNRTRMSSYPMPPRGVGEKPGDGMRRNRDERDGERFNHARSRSEPDFGNHRTHGGGGKRSNGVGQPRYYKSHSTLDRTKRAPATATARGGGGNTGKRAGYTSDGNYKTSRGRTTRGTTTRTSGAAVTTRAERKNSNTNRATSRGRNDKSSSKEEARRRARSEPRRSSRNKSRDNGSGSSSGGGQSVGNDDCARFGERERENTYTKKPSSNNNNTRSDRRSRDFDDEAVKRRSRAKSAPARCAYSKKNKDGKQSSSSKPTSCEKEYPKEFYCPLTKRVMKDPVMDPDGNAYEREAIERWLRVQSSSPITNGYLSLEMLKPSKELKSKIHKVTGE